MRHRLFYIFVFFILSFVSTAQTSIPDSLHHILSTREDTSRIEVLIELYNYYEDQNIEKGKQYLDEAYAIAQQYDSPIILGDIHLKLGNYYNLTNQYTKAIEHYEKAKEVNLEWGLEKSEAVYYNNVGIIFEKQGKYSEALDYGLKALHEYEKMQDSSEIARALLNVGLIHFRLEDYDKSRNYYLKSLEIRERIGDEKGIALVYNNLAILNYYENDYDNVRNYFEKAYETYKKLGLLRQEAMALSNLAEIHSIIGQNDKALEYYFKVLEMEKEMNNSNGMASTYSMIGNIYNTREQFDKALFYHSKAEALAKDIDALPVLKDVYDALKETYKNMGNYEKALHVTEQYIFIQDSLLNERRIKEIAEIQTKYETEKKEQEIALLKQEKEIQDLEMKKQQNMMFFMVASLVLFLLFLLVLTNKNKKISAANEKLSYQKNQITDSIEYASRIQNALLPPESYRNELLPEHFVFYKPRDIVSGDFYWFYEKGDYICVAAVDCTGHGVPGAFMSMLGNAFLQEEINEARQLHADKILNGLRERVKKALHQTGKQGEAKDGMDLALVIIHRERLELRFAGAYNQLFIIREGKLKVLKGDRMPIGIHHFEKESFTQHVLQLQEGDQLYMFSDGYVDQFGGEEGHKFRMQQFKEVLLAVSHLSMKDQKERLEERFCSWKGDKEQIDDVLVMGMKV